MLPTNSVEFDSGHQQNMDRHRRHARRRKCKSHFSLDFGDELQSPHDQEKMKKIAIMTVDGAEGWSESRSSQSGSVPTSKPTTTVTIKKSTSAPVVLGTMARKSCFQPTLIRSRATENGDGLVTHMGLPEWTSL